MEDKVFFKSGEEGMNNNGDRLELFCWRWTQHLSSRLDILMKVVVAVILAVLISSCEGQKGGAKSAMRNRGRGGSGRGRSTMGRNNGNNGGRGQDDIFGNGSGRKSCVGLCFLRWNSYFCTNDIDNDNVHQIDKKRKNWLELCSVQMEINLKTLLREKKLYILILFL